MPQDAQDRVRPGEEREVREGGRAGHEAGAEVPMSRLPEAAEQLTGKL